MTYTEPIEDTYILDKDSELLGIHTNHAVISFMTCFVLSDSAFKDEGAMELWCLVFTNTPILSMLSSS